MEQLIEFIANHPYLSGSFALLLALLIANELRSRGGGTKEVSPMDAIRIVNREHGVMVDVRDAKEWEQGHIANAIHAPLGELEQQLKKLEKYKKKPVIAYCRTGQRSADACRRLEQQGFETVYKLQGGLTTWQRENLPVKRG